MINRTSPGLLIKKCIYSQGHQLKNNEKKGHNTIQF
jgi:hypothetical protein